MSVPGAAHLRLYQGAIKALLKLSQGSIKAVLKLKTFAPSLLQEKYECAWCSSFIVPILSQLFRFT
jgi:hypothetical protein